MLSFESAQFSGERVVLGVRNGRRVVDEVRVVVSSDLFAQPNDALGVRHDEETIAAPSTTVGSSTR